MSMLVRSIFQTFRKITIESRYSFQDFAASSDDLCCHGLGTFRVVTNRCRKTQLEIPQIVLPLASFRVGFARNTNLKKKFSGLRAVGRSAQFCSSCHGSSMVRSTTQVRTMALPLASNGQMTARYVATQSSMQLLLLSAQF